MKLVYDSNNETINDRMNTASNSARCPLSFPQPLQTILPFALPNLIRFWRILKPGKICDAGI